MGLGISGNNQDCCSAWCYAYAYAYDIQLNASGNCNLQVDGRYVINVGG